MKEYTKGNILLKDLGGWFYLHRYDEFVENFTKQDLLDLHSLLSEILETPTVKEPEFKGALCKGSYALGTACGLCERCAYWKEHERVEDGRTLCMKRDCKWHQHTTFACPVKGCPGTPPSSSEKEKEDTERDIRMLMSGFPHYLYRIKEPVSDELMIASGYIKTPSGWIAHGEATPAQMAYHMDWVKSKKEPVKKPLLAIFNGKIDVNESLRRIAKYLDENK